MFRRTSHTVASTNGVELVTYRYEHSVSDGDGDASGDGGAGGDNAMQPIVFSHATGFHGRVFSPVAAHLANFSCTTFDYRGYGDTAAPADWPLSWEGFGDDALAIARYVAAQHGGTPLVGVGHSMGGAGLVIAALREPRLFAALVLFEPIIFPPEVRTQAGRGNPLADVTRRRRATFGSFEDAIDNFSSKPPLSSLHRDALDAYVRFGFTQHADGVHIKCQPEFEARTYEMGAMHDTWLALDQLRVPTWVMAGRHADHSPAAIAPRIAERIPNSTFVEWPDLGHFGPLEDPARFAEFVADVARTARRT